MIHVENVKDKVFIITGGATGIGKATALKLALAGAKVVINYRSSEKEAKILQERIQTLGGKAILSKADVASQSDVRKMIQQTVHAFGHIDGLINNASITSQIAMNDLQKASGEIWDSLYKTNVKGMFHCVQETASYMKKGGSIVNIGSIAGVTGIGSSIPYAATKAAIHTMTKSLAVALAPHIRVNCIAPGAVDTPWWTGYEKKMYELAGHLPLQRISSPEEIADSILFMLTQPSITGQVVTIDNGQTLT